MEAAKADIDIAAAAVCPESAPNPSFFDSGEALHPDLFQTVADADDFLAEMRSGCRRQASASVAAAAAAAATITATITVTTTTTTAAAADGEQREFSDDMSLDSTVGGQPFFSGDDDSGSRSDSMEFSDDDQEGENHTTKGENFGLTLPSTQQEPPVLCAGTKGEWGVNDGVVAAGKASQHQEFDHRGHTKQEQCRDLSDGSVGSLLMRDAAIEEENVERMTAKESRNNNPTESEDSKEVAMVAAAAAAMIYDEGPVLGSITAGCWRCPAAHTEEGALDAIVEQQVPMMSLLSTPVESEDEGGSSPSPNELPQAATDGRVRNWDEARMLPSWNNGQNSVWALPCADQRQQQLLQQVEQQQQQQQQQPLKMQHTHQEKPQLQQPSNTPCVQEKVIAKLNADGNAHGAPPRARWPTSKVLFVEDVTTSVLHIPPELSCKPAKPDGTAPLATVENPRRSTAGSSPFASQIERAAVSPPESCTSSAAAVFQGCCTTPERIAISSRPSTVSIRDDIDATAIAASPSSLHSAPRSPISFPESARVQAVTEECDLAAVREVRTSAEEKIISENSTIPAAFVSPPTTAGSSDLTGWGASENTMEGATVQVCKREFEVGSSEEEHINVDQEVTIATSEKNSDTGIVVTKPDNSEVYEAQEAAEHGKLPQQDLFFPPQQEPRHLLETKAISLDDDGSRVAKVVFFGQGCRLGNRNNGSSHGGPGVKEETPSLSNMKAHISDTPTSVPGVDDGNPAVAATKEHADVESIKLSESPGSPHGKDRPEQITVAKGLTSFAFSDHDESKKIEDSNCRVPDRPKPMGSQEDRAKTGDSSGENQPAEEFVQARATGRFDYVNRPVAGITIADIGASGSRHDGRDVHVAPSSYTPVVHRTTSDQMLDDLLTTMVAIGAVNEPTLHREQIVARISLPLPPTPMQPPLYAEEEEPNHLATESPEMAIAEVVEYVAAATSPTRSVSEAVDVLAPHIELPTTPSDGWSMVRATRELSPSPPLVAVAAAAAKVGSRVLALLTGEGGDKGVEVPVLQKTPLESTVHQDQELHDASSEDLSAAGVRSGGDSDSEGGSLAAAVECRSGCTDSAPALARAGLNTVNDHTTAPSNCLKSVAVYDVVGGAYGGGNDGDVREGVSPRKTVEANGQVVCPIMEELITAEGGYTIAIPAATTSDNSAAVPSIPSAAENDEPCTSKSAPVSVFAAAQPAPTITVGCREEEHHIQGSPCEENLAYNHLAQQKEEGGEEDISFAHQENVSGAGVPMYDRTIAAADANEVGYTMAAEASATMVTDSAVGGTAVIPTVFPTVESTGSEDMAAAAAAAAPDGELSPALTIRFANDNVGGTTVGDGEQERGKDAVFDGTRLGELQAENEGVGVDSTTLRVGEDKEEGEHVTGDGAAVGDEEQQRADEGASSVNGSTSGFEQERGSEGLVVVDGEASGLREQDLIDEGHEEHKEGQQGGAIGFKNDAGMRETETAANTSCTLSEKVQIVGVEYPVGSSDNFIELPSAAPMMSLGSLGAAMELVRSNSYSSLESESSAGSEYKETHDPNFITATAEEECVTNTTIATTATVTNTAAPASAPATDAAVAATAAAAATRVLRQYFSESQGPHGEQESEAGGLSGVMVSAGDRTTSIASETEFDEDLTSIDASSSEVMSQSGESDSQPPRELLTFLPLLFLIMSLAFWLTVDDSRAQGTPTPSYAHTIPENLPADPPAISDNSGTALAADTCPNVVPFPARVTRPTSRAAIY